MIYSTSMYIHYIFVIYFVSAIQLFTAINATTNSISYSTRAHWMRAANQALSLLESPCPFAAFGTVIVNHTAHGTDGLGQLVCMGVNQNSNSGNPTLHGEMSAIGNCSTIFTANYGLTAEQALNAFKQLSLYTNAESCSMCASAIRWAGFKEYIFGTSIDSLIKYGWGQIKISSFEIFNASKDLSSKTEFISGVLTNETDPYFKWQYNPKYPCPAGCQRTDDGTTCVQSEL